MSTSLLTPRPGPEPVPAAPRWPARVLALALLLAAAPLAAQQATVPESLVPQTHGTGANAEELGPALPNANISAKAAERRYGVEHVAADAREATRVIIDADPETERAGRRLTRRFAGPLLALDEETRTRRIHALGITELNEDALFDESITQSGLITALYAFPGEIVPKGKPLMSIFSPERVNEQHMLLADFSKDEGNQISLQYFSSFQSTEAYLEGSRANMRWWGFSDAQIDKLLETGEIVHDYVVPSAHDGYVRDIPRVTGELVVAGDRGDQSFVLSGEVILNRADLRTVWAMVFVDPADYAYFEVGDPVDVIVGEGDDQWPEHGVVVHKHEYASTETRLATFHILLDNADHAVRPGTFIHAHADKEISGLWLPESAVLHTRRGPRVLLRDDEGFVLQPVAVGEAVDGALHVTAGLDPGARVLLEPRAELDPDAHEDWLDEWE